MATYYISPYGSASNTGLSPDPASGSSGPMLTITNVLGSSGVAVAGDSVFICPGVYRASSTDTTITVSGSSGNPINVYCDVMNAKGFKDSSGNTVSPGEVRFTTYITDDFTLPTNDTILYLNNASYINFYRFWFVCTQSPAGFTGAVNVINGSHDNLFKQCSFSCGGLTTANGAVFFARNTATQLPLNLTIDECRFYSTGADPIRITLTAISTGGDYASGVVIKNSLFIGGKNNILIFSSGTNTYYGGGIMVINCTLMFCSATNIGVNTGSNLSTTIQSKVMNCLISGSTGSVSSIAGTADNQIVEDYNQILGGLTHVASGAHSTSDGSHCLLLDFGQWMSYEQYARPFLTPTVGSPQLGFGSPSGAPLNDGMGRFRPEGGKSTSPAVGYVERHNSGIKETSIVDAGSSIRLIGPSSQELQLPVTTSSTTISVKCYYDSLHGTTTPPQFMLVSAPALGINDNLGGSGINQIVTAPATTGSWNTLTLSPVTPTAKGVVKVLLVNRSISGSGNAYFDTLSVS